MADVFKGLVDQWGRPIEKQALIQEQAAPTSAGVRRHDSHHPAAGLTPGRLARILRNSIDGDPEDYLALAEDMEERDMHYASVLSTRKVQVSGLEITVEAAGDDPRSIEHADMVRLVVERDAFQIELKDILDATGKGFSNTEILWDTSEGQWLPKELKWRDPRWFTFDPVDGETPLLRDIGGDVPLKPFSWIRHQSKAKSGLPIRGGLARSAAWAFLFKSFTLKDWAIFCEAYGQPLRLGKYDPGATDRDKEILLEAVTNIGVDYAAIVPQAMTVEFIKADIAGSHELYERRAEFLDRQISKLVLGQTATTDAIAGGHAVGRTHDKVRGDIEEDDARQASATLIRDLARPVVDLNFGPQKKYPRIRIGRPEDVDVGQLVDNVVKLVPFGLRVSASVMRDKIGLPDPGPKEELLTAPRTPAAADLPDRQEPKPGAPGIARGIHGAAPAEPATDAIDDTAADEAQDWRELVGPIVNGLGERIAAATSVEQVQAILAERFAGMDVSALTERLAQAAFASRIAGEVDEPLA